MVLTHCGLQAQVVISNSFIAISAGTANNAGAILVLGRDLVVVPKLIHPLPPAIPFAQGQQHEPIEDTWMQVLSVFSFSFNYSK